MRLKAAWESGQLPANYFRAAYLARNRTSPMVAYAAGRGERPLLPPRGHAAASGPPLLRRAANLPPPFLLPFVQAAARPAATQLFGT